MEAAISVIGLLAAGSQIYTSLNRFISTVSDAPLLAHTLCNEVRDFRYALSKLQPYVDGSVPIKLLGASMIDVHHLSLTLAAAVFTFSKLEKKLDRLLVRVQVETPDDRGVARDMDTLSRLKWLRDEGYVSQLVQHIQQHKSTLNLLLTVLISESLTEAEEGRTRLEEGLTDIIACLSGQHQSTLPAQITEANQNTSSIDPLGRATEMDASSIMTVTSISSRLYRRSFESALFSSRPYRTITRSSVISSTSSQRRGTRWSIYSGGSNTSVFSLPLTSFEPVGQTLAGTDVRAIALPIRTDSLHNPWWYDTKIRPPRDVIPLPSRTLSLVSLGLKSVESALLEAVKSGDTEAVMRMIARGAHIETADSEGQTAVIWATRQNDGRMVRILLNEGANINQMDPNGFTLLHNAVTAGHQEITELLLNRGVKFHGKGIRETALHCAVRMGHVSIVELLLDRGADVEGGDTSGRIPLSPAIDLGLKAMTEMLLDRRADIEGRNAFDRSPLFHAIQWDKMAVVKMLLNRGAGIERSDSLGRTPLFHAIELGRKDMAEMLLDQGADIERRDTSDCTPLIFAVDLGMEAMVQMLLNRGADIERGDISGGTPLFHARKKFNQSMARMLVNRGGSL